MNLAETMMAYARRIIDLETIGISDTEWKRAHRQATELRRDMVEMSGVNAGKGPPATIKRVPLVRLGQGDFTTDYTPEGEKQ